MIACGAVGLLATVLLGMAGVPAKADGFTAQQRAEIVDVVRVALKADPSILRDAIAALQEQDESQQEVAARAAIPGLADALTRTPGDPAEGNPQGDVTVVEFFDVRCPYCRRMLPVLADLLARDHNLRVVYKDFPILGPGSVLGAKALLAAQKQGGYVKLKNAVMTGPAEITPDTLRAAVAKTGLDWDRLQKDMADPAVQQRIEANLGLARKLGISGTPAYVIGGQMLPGALDLAELQDAVAAARKP
jgi:protein-disulfide isomerase